MGTSLRIKEGKCYLDEDGDKWGPMEKGWFDQVQCSVSHAAFNRDGTHRHDLYVKLVKVCPRDYEPSEKGEDGGKDGKVLGKV